jgi:plastocyanin
MKIDNRVQVKMAIVKFVSLFAAFSLCYGCGAMGGGDEGGDKGGGGNANYSISGQVTLNGTGLSGVTMTYSIYSYMETTTTDASGNYTFTRLNNGTYTITPNKIGFAFSPTSSQQSVNGANITGANFTAIPGLTISGQVTSAPAPPGLSGITMELSGASSATTTTDLFGHYTFFGLDNGSYTITPTSTGVIFSPASSQQTLSGVNITGVNFTGRAPQYPHGVTCPPSGTTNVTIQDNVFTPQNVTISANGIVKWTNNGPSVHTVTSGTTPTPDGHYGNFNLPVGAWTCVQFYETGTYPYFCTIHPTMTGFVTVQ